MEDDDDTKPAAETAPTIDNSSTRRYSQRERQSTLVYIDGQAVLAKNNYVLKGDSFSYGAFETQAQPAKKLASNAAINAKPSMPCAPHLLSDAEVKRASHNEAVCQRVLSKATTRKKFLAENLDMLKYFLDEKTIRALTPSLVSGCAKLVNQMMGDLDEYVMEQPSGITGTLRDYQMEGLRFMAAMYQKNVGCILRDEKGLGKTLQTISLLSFGSKRHAIYATILRLQHTTFKLFLSRYQLLTTIQ